MAGWAAKMNAGMSASTVATSFLNSTEHRQDEVQNYYEQFLHRAPDSSSSSFCAALQSGVSEEQVAEEILDSAEYQSEHHNATLFIQDLYQDVLGRVASASDVSGWIANMSSGTTRNQVVAAFVQSTEAVDQVVDSFYTAYLHRQPETGGSNIFVTMLESPTGSATTAALGILTSAEFINDAENPHS
jgi:hypothetical protein